VEYNGDFQDLDMSPVTTGFVKGLLDPMVPDEVNTINAPMLAKEKGIKVSETSTAESQEFTNLISAEVVTTAETYRVAGTVFGKSDSRIVRINDFRIEIVPQGHLALIHNIDEPGAIGSIGNALGENGINISRMQVGREANGGNNIILIRTDTPINAAVIENIQALSKVKNIRAFEL